MVKYKWQKKHLENQTGTDKSYKPIKIRKDNLKKNMKLGSKIFLIILFFIFPLNLSLSEEKITSTPLLNIDKIKPSFEELNETNEAILLNQNLKEKKNITSLKSSQAVLIGLDKITAKSSELLVNLNERKKFGPLEIKILKCGKVKINNKTDSVAYMQVKDLSKNENEKVFHF